jgi:hypothetical protein
LKKTFKKLKVDNLGHLIADVPYVVKRKIASLAQIAQDKLNNDICAAQRCWLINTQ